CLVRTFSLVSSVARSLYFSYHPPPSLYTLSLHDALPISRNCQCGRTGKTTVLALTGNNMGRSPSRMKHESGDLPELVKVQFSGVREGETMDIHTLFVAFFTVHRGVSGVLMRRG